MSYMAKMVNKMPKSNTKNSKKSVKEIDPDRLSLQKNDILNFCDRVLERWNKATPNQNMAKNIAAMFAVRTAVYFTDEDSLKAIWSEIVKWVYQLLYENAMAQAKGEKLAWATTMEKLNKQDV